MRFKSQTVDGYTIYAISGINTISFAIDFTKANTKNLLGFAIERLDHKNNERYFVKGYKIFKELIPNPDETTVVNTYDHRNRLSQLQRGINC